MTNRDRKSGPGRSGGGYRNPPPAADPPRKGFFDNLLSPRIPSATSMPRIRTAFTRGVVTVMGAPVLVIAPILYVLFVWLVLIALGYEGAFAPLANLLALPPIGTSLDATLATSVFGLKGGIFGMFAFLAVRAAALAFLATAAVAMLDEGHVTAARLRRGLRVLPVTFATCVIGVAILYFGSFIAQILGPGFGILVQIASVLLGVYLFVFAPIAAADQARPMPETLARATRAARMPGTGNLTLAALYVLPSLVVIFVRAVPGGLIGANPTVGGWVYVLGLNLLHVALLTTFAFRYLSVAHEVPDAPARAARSARGGGRGRR